MRTTATRLVERAVVIYAPGHAPEARTKPSRVRRGAGFRVSCLSVNGEKLFISILTKKISTADQVRR